MIRFSKLFLMTNTMKIDFLKYQGAGNDFVMLDNRDGRYSSLLPNQIAALCDRRFGIGADGVLLLSLAEGYAFRMKYYNSDGSLASFCGNGARCICAFADHLGVVRRGEKFSFVADDGDHEAVCSQDWVDLKMIDVLSVTEVDGGYFMNTGVPHFVRVVDDLDAVDIMAIAPKLRYNTSSFGLAGTNVNFIHIDSPTSISVRTYERGVEGETLACGTGIVASSISASRLVDANSFDVNARGGRLRVSFQFDGSKYTDVYLCGPAVGVFSGSWGI